MQGRMQCYVPGPGPKPGLLDPESGMPTNRPLHLSICTRDYYNSEAHECQHDSDKTLRNKLEWWMILKISLRAKAKTLMKQKLHLHSLYFPQNNLIVTESCREFSDLHSSFRLCALLNRSQPLHNVLDNSDVNAFAKTSSKTCQDSHWLDKIKRRQSSKQLEH